MHVFSDAARRTRTADPCIFSALLYQLSYSGEQREIMLNDLYPLCKGQFIQTAMAIPRNSLFGIEQCQRSERLPRKPEVLPCNDLAQLCIG